MPLLSIIPDSLNLVNPSFKEAGGSTIQLQCSRLQNFILRDGRLYSAPGTERVFPTAESGKVRWGIRYYGRREDGLKIKKLFAYINGKIFFIDESALTAASVFSGQEIAVQPTSMTFQVSGNSVMFVCNGKNFPIEYDGNDGNNFKTVNSTLMPFAFAQMIEHLDRAWGFIDDSSSLEVSANLNPNDFIDSDDTFNFTVGNEKGSKIMALFKLGEVLYIAKDDSIWELFGRTPDEWGIRRITGKFGFAGRRAYTQVGSGIMFLNSYDHEWYSFAGSEQSITDLTSTQINFSKLANVTSSALPLIHAVEFDGFARIAFNDKEAEGDFNDSELIFPTKEIGSAGLPKFSTTKGANPSYYIPLDQQDDTRELVIGRSDTGLLMYVGRGNDFDEIAIDKQMRFFNIIPALTDNVIFSNFWVYGKADGDNTVGFRHYPNSDKSDFGNVSYNQSGEQTTIGGISIEKQEHFNTKIPAITRYARGESMAVEIRDNTRNRRIELYRISVEVTLTNKVRTKHRGS